MNSDEIRIRAILSAHSLRRVGLQHANCVRKYHADVTSQLLAIYKRHVFTRQNRLFCSSKPTLLQSKTVVLAIQNSFYRFVLEVFLQNKSYTAFQKPQGNRKSMEHGNFRKHGSNRTSHVLQGFHSTQEFYGFHAFYRFYKTSFKQAKPFVCL